MEAEQTRRTCGVEARRVVPLNLNKQAEAAARYAEESKIGVEVFFFFLQKEIEDQDAESEEEQLHFRQDGQPIAVDVVDDRREEGMHSGSLSTCLPLSQRKKRKNRLKTARLGRSSAAPLQGLRRGARRRRGSPGA